MSRPVVLLVGATGLFGALLAKRLLRAVRVDLVCAGRNGARLEQFCKENGGRFQALDREDHHSVEDVLSREKPFATIDCSGPFQAYGDDPYRFARAVIEAGSHYFDIADCPGFVGGFHVLDALAKEKGVTALTGVSVTPAMTSGVVDHLTQDISGVESITTALVPGNRARRTLSVMRSILFQVGQPMMQTQNGERQEARGWTQTESFDLSVNEMPAVKGRLASLVDMPDDLFFAQRYGARNVAFKAGLEVKLFHHAMSLGGWFVRSGAIKSLEPFARPMRLAASWFEWMGTDQGGMKVCVVGRRRDGQMLRREWDLIADGGHGPNIPTLPVSILLEQMLDGKALESGARPSLGDITPEQIQAALDAFGGKTQIHESPVLPLFRQVLGDDFDALPATVKALHNRFGKTVYEGRANVKGATGLFGRIAALLVGFPSDMNDIPVRVTLTADDKSETWVRKFGEKTFRSHMSIQEGKRLRERFGIFSARVNLCLKDGKLLYPVSHGRLFGLLPLPGFLMPQSIAHERVDEEGRFVFDVLIQFPFGGRIAHYQGWLERVDQERPVKDRKS